MSKEKPMTLIVQCSYAEPEPFTETEAKLVRLALDPAARGGEIDTSAVKLVHSWRRRGVTPEEILSPATAPTARTALEVARRRPMPFGKYRGRQLQAIEPSYLRWVLQKAECASLELKEAIRLVLRAGGSS